MLVYRKVVSDLDLMIMKENMNNIIYENKCIYGFTIDDDNIKLNGFNRDKNMSFSIDGNSKDIILKFKDDICLR